jgi:hypothetical protein
MKTVLICVAVLVGLWLLRKLVGFLIVRGLSGVVGRAIGSTALARQPDAIHLTSCVETAWKDEDAAANLVAPFRELGFDNAGAYRVPELPGVIVQLLANERDRLYAAVYEHPHAGHWFDVVCRFEDGTSATYTTANPTGLDPRPGHPVVNAPGARAQALVERARSESQGKRAKPAARGAVTTDFETAYAESIAWRKSRGISAQEVGRVAQQKAA